MKKADTTNVIHLIDRKLNSTTKESSNSRVRNPRVITITSGKGGVGKTNIVANLGFALGRFGQKVLVLDADLGLGNLDVLLGLAPTYNLSHVIHGEKRLAEIVVPGPGKLQILPAASGIQELTSLNNEARYRIFSQLEEFILNFDILLIDTAAGISANVLYFNINADEILVVATPEPTSITDAYALMKVLSVKYGTNHFKLLVNGVASAQEGQEVFRQLNLVADRFLNISLEYYGEILADENVRKGVRQQKIVSDWAPLTKASRGFATLARKIAGESPAQGAGRSAKWQLTDFPNC